MAVDLGGKLTGVLIMPNGAHVPLGAPLDVPPDAPLDAEQGEPAVSAQDLQPECAPVRGAAQPPFRVSLPAEEAGQPAAAVGPHVGAQPHGEVALPAAAVRPPVGAQPHGAVRPSGADSRVPV